MIRRAAAAVHRFFSFEIDPFALGLYRAALGAYLVLFYVMMAPSWLLFHGTDGITPVPLTGAAEYRPLEPIFWYARSEALMWAAYGLSLASAVLVALGIRWRIALVWLWHMNLTLLHSNAYVVNGEEQVLAILLLFSLFLPLGASFTWAQLVRRERRQAMFASSARVRVWALRALELHVMFIYLASLPDKLADSAWRDGTLVYYAMMANDYPRWPGLDLFAWGNAALSRALTMFSLAVESLVPLLIWFRRLRVPCVLAAMSLHLGMALLLEGVAMFNGAMVVALILFLPGRRTRVWLAGRFGWASRGRGDDRPERPGDIEGPDG